jgi:hypothetical protein
MASANPTTRELATAFEAVFGQPDARSREQRLVATELEHRCFFKEPILGLKRTGGMCPEYGRWGEGRRSVWLIILSQLEAAQAKETPADKPKAIRR